MNSDLERPARRALGLDVGVPCTGLGHHGDVPMVAGLVSGGRSRAQNSGVVVLQVHGFHDLSHISHFLDLISIVTYPPGTDMRATPATSLPGGAYYGEVRGGSTVDSKPNSKPNLNLVCQNGVGVYPGLGSTNRPMGRPHGGGNPPGHRLGSIPIGFSTNKFPRSVTPRDSILDMYAYMF